jgi:trk system potassium uptake protein TrkH
VAAIIARKAEVIFSAVASSLGNVGPGLDSVGPAGNYLEVPLLGKWLLAGLMIVGRLEILPIVILFNRESWNK